MILSELLSALPPVEYRRQGGGASVEDTPEFRRIRDAPREHWQDAPDLPALTQALTQHLRTPSGEQTLRPIQAAALRCLHDLGCAFVPLRTGGGKTLISFLAPEIVGAKRPLLIVPAKLVNGKGGRPGKTHREHALARRHWRLRPIMTAAASKARVNRVTGDYTPLRVVSYEALGRTDYADALENWQPDLLIFDECHKVKDPKAAVTRRIGRFVKANRPKILLESGSITNRSPNDYAHSLRWALGDNTPLPRDWPERMQWVWALAEKVADSVRVEPGALLGLSPAEPEDGEDPITQARKRYARRLRTMPGVIASGTDLPEVLLTACVEKLPPDAAMLEVQRHLRAHWETPCGHPFEMATDLWRHERELSCGLYYRWDVQPPFEWLRARKDWSAFVRETLAHSRTLDSPLSVANAIDAGRLADNGVLEAWRAVAHLFRPEDHQETVWVSDQTLRACAVWLESERGICWVQHVAFGQRLSEITGVPYFARGGVAGAVCVDQHNGPAILSIQSGKEGFNLQHLHHKNLIATTPTTNEANEQLISRTHRDGQENEVEIAYLQTLEGDEKALDSARADAVYVESTTLQPQRLNAATWIDE